MASYHCSMKVGTKGQGARHADYIAREGRYASAGHDEYIERSGRFSKYEDLVCSESGNMPEWARENPKEFWRAAEEFERANGRVYREIEVAIPNELTQAQQKELVKEFVEQQLGKDHPYTYAIHDKPASLNPAERQPHAHIMFSERKNDGIERPKETFFKQAARPSRGEKIEEHGAKKDRQWIQKSKLEKVRADWADLQNKYLERYGHEIRVDHRNLEDQKISAIERGDIEKAKELNREPERHLGPKVAQKTVREAKQEMAKGQTKEERIEIRNRYYEKDTTSEKSRQAVLVRQYKKEYIELQKDKVSLDVERIRQNVPIREIKPETALKYAQQVFLRKAEKQIEKDEKTLGQQRQSYYKELRALAAAMKKNPEDSIVHSAEKERLEKWRESVEKKEHALQDRKEQVRAKQIPPGSEKQVDKIAQAILVKDQERLQKLREAASEIQKGQSQNITPAEMSKLVSERQKTIPVELDKLSQQKAIIEKKIVNKETAQAVAISVYTKGENKRLAVEQKRVLAERQRPGRTPEDKQKLLTQIQSYNARAGQLSKTVNSDEGRKNIGRIAEKIQRRNQPYQAEISKISNQIESLKTERITLRELRSRIPTLDKNSPIEIKGHRGPITQQNIGRQGKNLTQSGRSLLQNRMAAQAPKAHTQARIADDEEPTKKRGHDIEM